MKSLLALSALLAIASIAHAGEADVTAVKAIKSPDGTYRFAVTVSHDDEGWKHYADKWDIVTPDGKVIATRTLYHPHVNEQPFTRSLSGVELPQGIRTITIRAHDLSHGYGGKTISIAVPQW